MSAPPRFSENRAFWGENFFVKRKHGESPENWETQQSNSSCEPRDVFSIDTEDVRRHSWTTFKRPSAISKSFMLPLRQTSTQTWGKQSSEGFQTTFQQIQVLPSENWTFPRRPFEDISQKSRSLEKGALISDKNLLRYDLTHSFLLWQFKQWNKKATKKTLSTLKCLLSSILYACKPSLFSHLNPCKKWWSLPKNTCMDLLSIHKCQILQTFTIYHLFSLVKVHWSPSCWAAFWQAWRAWTTIDVGWISHLWNYGTS